jgi:putative Holliday junction resolvase
MKLLGIDYGQRKIGLAFADSFLAEPLRVIRFEAEDEVLEKIKKVVEEEEVDKVVIGLSEGEMAEKTIAFAQKLAKVLTVPMVFQDETFSTQDAQRLSIESGMKKAKRKGLEDAFAAAVMLQSFLDKHV